MEGSEDRVEILQTYEFPDAQPHIEAVADYLSYELGSFENPLNFIDRTAYDTRFAKEAAVISKLQYTLQTGEYFVSTLYTYRSCSRALPQVRSNDDPNKNELYRKIYEVLEPEIKKMHELMHFVSDATKSFCLYVEDLLKPEKRRDIVSDLLLQHLVRLLDLLLKLDTLKLSKAGLNNDFSFYKRAFQQVNGGASAGAQDENFNLHNFLSQSSSVINGLKESLRKISGYEEAISCLMHQALSDFEESRFVLANDRHMLLRVSTLCVFLLDTPESKDVTKRFRIDRAIRLLKQYPYIPLYGDMTFHAQSVLQKCPHYTESEWGLSVRLDSPVAKRYLLVNDMKSFRDSYSSYVAEFVILTNMVRDFMREHPGTPLSFDTCDAARNLVQKGMLLISDWSTRVLEQCAWKYCHPVAETTQPTSSSGTGSVPPSPATMTQPLAGGGGAGGSGSGSATGGSGGGAGSTPTSPTSPPRQLSEYERVVRFNYTAEERAALVDIVGMIKGLESTIVRAQGLLSPLIRRQIFRESQMFVQSGLRSLLQSTKKRKKTSIFSTLLELRAIGANWLNNVVPKDPALEGKKTIDFPVILPDRMCPPSPTQLHLIRAIVSVCRSDRSSGNQGGFLKDKDFKEKHLKILNDFYAQSFYYPYLLNLESTLHKASDLADLWFREFFLELAKCIQFPIEMSLPWLLVDDILEKRNATLMESILFPLDLYNDAAHRALSVLSQRFLYDEIEAEVNLVFDQLVFKLSEQIYTYFKMRAASLQLDKQFREVAERTSKSPKFNVPRTRYDTLLKQKRINVLGRFVDLNHLLCQRVRNKLRDNLQLILSKLESGDLCNIKEIESLIENVRLTHDLLSQHFALEPFEIFFADVNDATSLISFENRIATHVCNELTKDAFRSFVFNHMTQRFVRPPQAVENSDAPYEREKVPRIPPNMLYGSKAFNTAFFSVHEIYKGYFGHEHMAALVRMVGLDTLPLVVDSCVSYIEERLFSSLLPYVKELCQSMPPTIKRQSPEYGLEGVYSYFLELFRDIADYPELRSGVFQAFREIGNALVFLQLLDTACIMPELSTAMHIAPFAGLEPALSDDQPLPHPPPKSRVENVLSEFHRMFGEAPIRAPAACSVLPTTAKEAVDSYTPKLSRGSIFQNSLEHIWKMLDGVRQEMRGGAPANRFTHLDTSREFYRLWSILQFLFAVQDRVPGDGEDETFTDRELFGDGFAWAGCTLVYLLDQHLRFVAFNFSDYVLDCSMFNTRGIENIKNFMLRASLLHDVNNCVFACLKAHYSLHERPIEYFQPPESDEPPKHRGSRIVVGQVMGAAQPPSDV